MQSVWRHEEEVNPPVYRCLAYPLRVAPGGGGGGAAVCAPYTCTAQTCLSKTRRHPHIQPPWKDVHPKTSRGKLRLDYGGGGGSRPAQNSLPL